jgi:lysophospholipase L1-like esterase
MVRSIAAAGLAAVVMWSGACAQSPTAPTPATGSVGIGSVSQEPAALPPSLVPNIPAQSLGATSFVAFGDSITWGTLSSFDGTFLYADEAGSYPRRLKAMLDTYNQPQVFTVTNEGLPGEGAFQAEPRLRKALAERRPQALLLLEGINDMAGAGMSATRAASSVAQLVQIARLFNITVLVSTMPQTYYSVAPDGRVRENANTQVVPFNTELRRLVTGLQNVYIVDMYASFGANRSLMGNDGLHPSPAGYDRMAQEFHAAIVRALPVRGTLQ